MRKAHYYVFVLLCFFYCCQSKDNSNINNADLEKFFKSPQSVTQTSIYWYWISDHISEEGVVKDLKAMKEAGINRAFIGNIGLNEDGQEGGKVKFGTDEWWKILHTAMKTATELEIDLGIFNSPGWSQSGGPWVKPNQAMRYLTHTSIAVSGGQKIDITLDKPEGDFEDVKLLAYPAISKEKYTLSNKNTIVSTIPNSAEYKSLLDGNKDTETKLKSNEKKEVVIDFKTNDSFVLHSLEIYPAHQRVNVPAEIQVRKEGVYKTLEKFQIDRYNEQLNVGFEPYSPIVIALPPTSASEFRLKLSNVKDEIGIKEIVLSSIPLIERYPEKTLTKMHQTPLPYWHEYQWRTQPTMHDKSLVVDASKIVDLSSFLSENRLNWDAPAGDWVIMRMGMLPTGVTNSPASKEATGLEVDKMSKEHVQAHFNAYMGEIIRRIPEADRKSWKVIVQDSYETGGQNFTDDFVGKFIKEYGYDPVPFFPTFAGIVVASEDESNRFLWDMRRLVADRIAYDYVAGLREISNKNGLTTWLENYGHWGYPGEFLQYGGQSDEIGGEFWAEGDLGNIENRAASSCGHIYGKTKISSESFTSAGNTYGRYPALLKQRGDRFFSEGINNTLLHLYVHQAYEDNVAGFNAWFGTEFNRKNTWFTHMDLFTTYLKRTNFMLQQGLNVADVAYFIGEDTPKMTGVAEPALPKGYQFDYINAEVIENYMTVKDGLLTLPHGTQYKILVLPKLETMRPELLDKIKSLIEDGGVILGSAPYKSPSLENYPQADNKVKEVANTLWNSIDKEKGYGKIGKGILIAGLSMEDALALIDCKPDLALKQDVPVLYNHRTLGDGREIYFVTNQGNTMLEFEAELRTRGMQPELWNPVTGGVKLLPSYSYTSTGTLIPIKLDINESAFIVFRNKGTDKGNIDLTVNYPIHKSTMELKGWTVSLENKLYPSKNNTIEMDIPEDLSKNANSDIQYFSGIIKYETNFEGHPDKGKHQFIKLNDLSAMAKVYVNNQYVGGIWTPPYQLEITDFVNEGDNSLKIEVTTTWVNSIVGDMRLSEDKRQIHLNANSWKGTDNLQKSGIVGFVSIDYF